MKDALAVMAEGNPGCLGFMMEIIKKGAEIDPDSALGGVGPILLMDSFGIYGSRCYMLWNDICNRDLVKSIAMLRACQLGFISPADLNAQIDLSYSHTLDVGGLLKKVREELRNFSPELIEEPTDADPIIP